MAAKKRKASKKSASKSETVMIALDADVLRVIKTAVEALGELALAVKEGSDDPAVRGARGGAAKKKSSKKAKKRARKTS